MIKVIFFDVDGTLVSSAKNEVPASTKAALDELRKNGVKCVLATGRHMLELAELPVGELEFDGYITLNGQLCLDDKGAIIYGRPFTEAETNSILALFEKKEIPIALVERDRMYINFVDHRVEQAQNAVSTAVPEVGNYTGNEIYLAMAYIDREEEGLLRKWLPSCKITRWNEQAVDIISCYGGKSDGIQQYLVNTQISKQETMAFGDGENDIEMLQFAEIGVAMGNAREQVKASADYVTADVDDDGIEKALKHYGLIR